MHDAVLGRPAVAQPVSTTEDLCARRLLAYFPDAELADGAAEDETAGFFDLFDAPPWDTWVALFDDGHATSAHSVYLVAWIPPRFAEVAEKGIEVNMMGSLAWLATTQTAVSMYLRRSGLDF